MPSDDVTTTLPNAHVAWVPEDKLVNYLLNPEHADGRHKARVFRAAFGVEREHWESFAELLVDGVQRGSVTNTREREDCVIYGVTFTSPGIDGADKTVVSSWKVSRDGDQRPSLVTAYLRP